MRQPFGRIWKESWFLTLSPSAKLLYLYMALHPQTSPLGWCLLTRQRLKADGLDLVEVELLVCLSDLAGTGQIVQGEDPLSVLVVRKVSEMPPVTPADVGKWAAECEILASEPALLAAAVQEAAAVAIKLPEPRWQRVPAVVREVAVSRRQVSSKSSDRWQRVPADEALTDDRRAFATSRLRGDDIIEEWCKFKDHEFRVPRQDVDATWRTWVRNASTPKGGRRTGARPRSYEPADSL